MRRHPLLFSFSFLSVHLPTLYSLALPLGAVIGLAKWKIPFSAPSIRVSSSLLYPFDLSQVMTTSVTPNFFSLCLLPFLFCSFNLCICACAPKCLFSSWVRIFLGCEVWILSGPHCFNRLLRHDFELLFWIGFSWKVRGQEILNLSESPNKNRGTEKRKNNWGGIPASH